MLVSTVPDYFSYVIAGRLEAYHHNNRIDHPPMPSPSLRSLATTAVLLILTYHFLDTITTTLCHQLPSALHPIPTSANTMTAAAAVDPSTHLALTIQQTGTTPHPTLTLTITNTHPSAVLTFVTWNTPLDDALVPLGLLAVTDPASAERLNKDAIKIARKTPPEADAFVTLAPGESREHVVELRDGPLMPLGKVEGGRVGVQVEGEWGDVWVDERVGPEAWGERSGKGVKGRFESGVVEVVV
ncbi:hypothetical protein SLS58_005413 [Diplodia intermedia]|uniref:Uncharacterized protein n=1 Tax=Diplodia intermedia TaxID=856260 RepID=A0ABR3TRF5_9PEZI